MLPKLNKLRSEQAASLEESTTRVGHLLGSLRDSLGELGKNRQSGLSELLSTASGVQGELVSSLEAVLSLKDRVEGVHELVSEIDTIANRTNLLSMNASIEAAHAGNSGKGSPSWPERYAPSPTKRARAPR